MCDQLPCTLQQSFDDRGSDAGLYVCSCAPESAQEANFAKKCKHIFRRAAWAVLRLVYYKKMTDSKMGELQ